MSFIKYNYQSKILFLGINKTGELLLCGRYNGFSIYNLDTFEEIINNKFNNGIGYIELLSKTSPFLSTLQHLACVYCT